MKNQHRVVWTKGMFLNPQLFQTQDQYVEDTVQFRFAASHFANWGVTALEVDAEALANGLFRLVAAMGVMPDGLSFDMPGVDALPASREIAEFFSSTEKSLSVYLALPEQHLEAANVTLSTTPGPSPAPAPTRYIAETCMIADQNLGAEKKAVQLARRNYRLLFEGEYRDGFTCLRVAQVVRNAAGAYILDPAFIAPCLDLAHSAYLTGLLRRQIEILATKSATLSGPRRGGKKRAIAATEVDSFLQLHTVNTHLPELRHIWEVRHGHPEAAYVAMLRLAGALSTFSQEARPDDLPRYDHAQLGPCFTELDTRIRDLIEIMIPSKFVPILLTLGEGSIWRGTVSDDRYFRDSQFFLAVSADIGMGEIINKVPLLVRLAAADDIDRLIGKALPGIELTYTPSPPNITPRLDSQYFGLSQVGDLWKQIVLSRHVAVYAPAEIKNARMELIAVFQ